MNAFLISRLGMVTLWGVELAIYGYEQAAIANTAPHPGVHISVDADG